jgi:hypothetical protein
MLASPVLMAGNVGTVLLWVFTTRSVIGWRTFREDMSVICAEGTVGRRTE